MREKEGKSSWKEKDCVLVASKESIKINILSPKDVTPGLICLTLLGPYRTRCDDSYI